MATKLIDRTDILNNLVNTVTPKYFPDSTLDKNRVSVYGYITEAMAISIEDTVTLEQRRAADYCPELSTSEIHVRETARIRNLAISRASPGKCFIMINVLKSDILAKGTVSGNVTTFIIDRRSTILYNEIPFSLEDDIVIRAVYRNGVRTYTANYSGEHSSYESYIQMFEQTSDEGELLVTLICQVYQYQYNIQEKTVTDMLEFTYDGITFDYENLLADFEVYYKESVSGDFIQANMEHYLSRTTNVGLYYSDDDSTVLRILNSTTVNVSINTNIRVEMKETLGTDGNITLMDDAVSSFTLYKDSAYNYSGVSIYTKFLSDTVDADNGDTLEDIITNMINMKTRRENITTEHDIVTYINDAYANVQIVKKRNDIQDRSYYMYTLVRYGDNKIAPATTKTLVIQGITNKNNTGDYDLYIDTVDRKIINAYNKFQLHIVDGSPDKDYVTKVPLTTTATSDTDYFLTCPFMILVDEYNIASYYFTSVDTSVLMHMMSINSTFPYQIICRSISIYRDSHSTTASNQYKVTIIGTMNTANDDELYDSATGTIKDKTAITAYLVFNNDNNPTAYLKMDINSYKSSTREFTFTGTFTTDDYITEYEELHITDGLQYIKTGFQYDSVIDYKDAQCTLYFMYKFDDTESLYTKTDTVYSLIPSASLKGYVLMSAYYNTTANYYNLIIEYNKFSKTPVIIKQVSPGEYQYTLKEVPFFEYDFGLANTASLYSTFNNMYQVYGSLLTYTTDFEISLKFIATYGNSKYITVVGGRNADGKDTTVDLKDLNPTFYFKIYGKNVDVDAVKEYIYEYLRDTYIIGNKIFMSNICTLVEEKFTAVKSIKYRGVNDLDASYQEFVYTAPDFTSLPIITAYIPEQFNVTDIQIELDENY